MLILLEGADGSGKTTLANTLSSFYGYKQLELPKPSLNYYDDLVRIIKGTNTNSNYICDRSFLTEYIYRIVDDKPTSIQLREILNLLPNCKVVLCETDTAFEDAIRRGEDNITKKKHHDLLRRAYIDQFDVLRKFADMRMMSYDWHKDDITVVIRFINS